MERQNNVEERQYESGSDDEIGDEFQDAYDFQSPDDMDLPRAMSEAQLAINHFFNNKFAEARAIMQPWANTSIYHALGEAVFKFLSATLTFDRDVIAEANAKLKHCMALCNTHRKRKTLGENLTTLVKKQNYDQYTDIELHAELCYAEVLLLRAILTFMEDEELLSLVKGSLKIKQCYNGYKECAAILKERMWTDQVSKCHFESGVRMGIGSFNLMISLLPGRIIRLLEFVGFSGVKDLGLDELVAGSKCEGGLRNVLCVMTLLGYHLIICYVLSDQPGDLKLCEELITKQLQLFPSGVWFLFYKGRLEFMKGNLEKAITAYKQSWKSQNIWPQFHHVVFWELLWVECMSLNWREALLYCDYLLESSKWSRTIYSYQKAAVMCMIWDQLSSTEKRTCTSLMNEAPAYKQRIAGKSLPMEKFVIRRCQRYVAQGNRLVVPAIEMMYLWNMFRVFKNNFPVGEKILRLVKSAESNVIPGTDEQILLTLIKGSILRHLGAHYQSLECLQEVIASKKQIKEDLHLVPYAIVEIALLFNAMGDKAKSMAALEDAKKNYSGYPLESRLHFRIHTALSHLKSE